MNDTHEDNRDRALRLLESLLVTRFGELHDDVSTGFLHFWMTILVVPCVSLLAVVYVPGFIDTVMVLLVLIFFVCIPLLP